MSEIRKTFWNLPAGTRHTARVRAINELGVFSEWSEACDFTTGNDTSIPVTPSGLTITFDTSTLVAHWNAATLNSDGTGLMDFRAYVVTVTAAGVTVFYEVTSPDFAYTLAQNLNDFTTPQPQITVAVRVSDVVGNQSPAVTGIGINPPPDTPTLAPSLAVGFTTVNITMPSQAGVLDLDGYDIYHSTTVDGIYGLLGTTTNGGNTYAHAVAQGSEHYYRYKTRDVFGQLSPELSPSAHGATFAALIEDNDPPDPLTNFRVLAQGLDEDQRAWIELAWDESPADDLASYEIRYRREGGSVFSSVFLGIGVLTYRFSNLVAGATYQFQIRATDVSSNTGEWVPTGTFEVATDADTVAPAPMTGLDVIGGVRVLLLQWNASTEFDFDHYDVHVATDIDFVPSSENLYSSPGPGTIESIGKAFDGTDWVELVPGQTYYIRTYVYDFSGNKSVVSPPLTDPPIAAATRFITNEDIVVESLTADKIATSEITAALTTTGSIRTATGGARMEMNSSGLIGYANDGVSENFRYFNSTYNRDGLTSEDKAGIVIHHEGYIKSSNYVAGVTGWYFGAGEGDGLLELNEGTIKARALQIGVSNENLVANSSFENYPASGVDIGLAREWLEFRNDTVITDRSDLLHTFAQGTGVDLWGPNFLFQSKSQKVTTTFVATSVGVAQQIDRSDTPILASSDEPAHVTVSCWVKMASTVNGNRNAYVTLRNVTADKNHKNLNSVVLADGGWHRVVHTAVMAQTAAVLEMWCHVEAVAGSLGAGETFYFEGAQVELSSYASTYTPAMLEIPDNYIQSAYIQDLTADKIDSGVITAALIEIKDEGRIQSWNYDETGGLEAGYVLAANELTFQNGGINIVKVGNYGGNGGVSLNTTNLKAEYGGVVQLLVNSSGISIGGDGTTPALYVDTAAERTTFSSVPSLLDPDGYTFMIDTNPDDGENKALRLYDTLTGVDSFYLTYDGLGYFAKGVIGTAGAGGNRIHNASFETTKNVQANNDSNMDYWQKYTTGTRATYQVNQVGVGTAVPRDGSSSCQVIWTGASSGARTGIMQAPAVSVNLNGVTSPSTSAWPATSEWTLTFVVAHLAIEGEVTPRMPNVGFSVGGITATPTPGHSPTPDGAWQEYVFDIVVDADLSGVKTGNLLIYFEGAKGNVIIDSVQLERGELSTPFGLMPEEFQWGVAPPMIAGDTLRSSNYIPNTQGWLINGDGNTEFNNITMRGKLAALAGTSTIELGKDVGGANGHHGLVLENNASYANVFIRRYRADLNDPANGRIFFRVNGTGTNSLSFDSADGVLRVNGNLTTGNLQATGGSFSGDITGATGTFSGSLSGATITGATGTFSGALSAATGTLGSLTVNGNLRMSAAGRLFMQDYYIRFRSSDDFNTVGYDSTVDGPTMTGVGGVRLNVADTGTLTLTKSGSLINWKVTGLPGLVGTALVIAGSNQIGPTTSVRAAKKNIRPLDSGQTNPLWSVRPQRFNWRSQKVANADEINSLHPDGIAGLILEDVLAVAPDAVHLDEDGEPMGFDDYVMRAYMFDMILHLRKRIEVLETKK